jgi:hypothetical protein
VRLSPSTETFAVTYVTVSGLAPLTAYTFQVYSENGVSKVSFYLAQQSSRIRIRKKSFRTRTAPDLK